MLFLLEEEYPLNMGSEYLGDVVRQQDRRVVSPLFQGDDRLTADMNPFRQLLLR